MIAEYRQAFNASFTGERYRALVTRMETRTRTKLQIRIAETPVFLPEELLARMVDAGAEMTRQLVGDIAYLRRAEATIPPKYRVRGDVGHPQFMTVDFGLVHRGGEPWSGNWRTLEPRLVELQAFPSVYGYQSVLTEEYRRTFELSPSLQSYLGGITEEAYWQRLSQTVLGEHAPEEVVLLEVTPELQKTVPDFHVHEDRLGIRSVDISAVRQRGRQLFYDRDGVETPIRRIYNRAIADEMERKGVVAGFDLTGDLEVEWAGHPNWYFLISKFSLPYLRHPYVPQSVFLNHWMAGGREGLRADRSQWVLKPLFSFAGKGVEFAPSDERLAGIPLEERGDYLLQERLHFQPVVETPYGWTQAEVRILYLWPEGGELQAVHTLVRLGRGLMMGVDHNRDWQWVGGSAGLIVPDE